MSTFFNPETGESFRFEDGQQPPAGWKPLQPIAPPHPVIAGGGSVFYAPGKEPRLYVDPETGKTHWVEFPYIEMQAGWLPLVPLNAPPPETRDEHEHFNPATGETYRFEPGQRPPQGWKRLGTVPPLHPVIAGGGCVLFAPGKEPRLYVDPKTGQTAWVPFPYIEVRAGWLAVVPLGSPPPLTEDRHEYFNPENGESFRFDEGRQPPPGWKALKPIPPRHPIIAGGGCVLYAPGKEPRLYVNPKTGEAAWLPYPFIAIPEGWIPLLPIFQAPPQTIDHRAFFNPQTGETCRLASGEPPPAGWRPIKPVPAPHPVIAGGGSVLYEPGKEPRLHVHPDTGESVWVPYPYVDVPAGSKLLVPREVTEQDAQELSVDPPLRSQRTIATSQSSVLEDLWNFVKEIPGSVAETFVSGEAYQSYAQGQHAAVRVMSFGTYGDPEARARELESQGFKRPDRRVEWIDREVLGPIIGAATSAAVATATWIRAGGATFKVAFKWQEWLPPFGHVIYGSGNAWVHALGPWFGMTVGRIAPRSLQGWWVLRGVPVLNSSAVLAEGQSAWLCFTAAATAYVRGWRFW